MKPPDKVRVTVNTGLGRIHVHEAPVNSPERTPSVTAHALINQLILHDGDCLTIDFVHVPGTTHE